MRRLLAPFVWAALLGSACDRKAGVETETPGADPDTPKLVVVLVVDQMRADYLERFAGQLSGGIAVLQEQGRAYDQTYHAHALTETAPGHATIATGCHPAHHGIIANEWFDRELGETVNAVDDREVEILGAPDVTGVSASTLLREGVGDWLQAADPAAVVISLSNKDRAAILMGGKRPDAAIWYEPTIGAFTTSTYYADELPAWVAAYNDLDRAAAFYGEAGWTLSREPEAYAGSRSETDPALVGMFFDYALTKTFPHVIDIEGKLPRHVIRDTPFGDQMTLELALEALEAEGMGQDAVPDLLFLSMSGGDYAGHRYGPFSVEVHDHYLRLDAALGAFIEDLDARFGQDYVMILTGDHGAIPMPEYSDIEGASRFYGPDEVPPMMEVVNRDMKLSEDQQPALEFSYGPDLVFPDAVDEATRADYRAALAVLLRERAELSDAWTRDELAGSDTRNEFAAMYRLSYHARAADILLQYAPGVYSNLTGSGHGTPYEYDQHVPLLIRGPGLGGAHDQRVNSIDIAPTIATLLGIAVPAEVDGEVLPRD